MNPTRDLLASFSHLPPDERRAALLARFWPPDDQPVLRQILERRRAAQLAGPRWPENATEQQIIPLAEARALAGHFEQHRRRALERGAPSDLVEQLPHIPREDLVPGRFLGAVYGVRLTIDDPAPMVAETVGGRVGAGWCEILTRLVPKGTRPDRYFHRYFTVHSYGGGTVKRAKEELARDFGEPHVIADLSVEDLLPGEASTDTEHLQPGWRVLYAATFRAIPGATPYIVYRPAPTLPEGWWPAGHDGRWMGRPSPASVRRIPLTREMDMVVGTATATGRVEVRDGMVAEVYEVTAP